MMSTCLLEGCNKKARRKFCSNKHKDKYHNRHNPRGRFAHLKEASLYEEEYIHPFSSEGLGQD